MVTKRKDEILTESEIEIWTKLNLLESLEAKITFEDLKEIYKHKADLTKDNIKANLETLRKCEIQ